MFIMEKQTNTSNVWLEIIPNSPLDEKILTYLKSNWFNKSVPEIYKACIWDKYSSSDTQKRRLVSYLIIKKDKLTIDLVLKNSGKNTDFTSKNSIFKSYVDKWLITTKTAWSLNYTWNMQQNLEMLHLMIQESFFDWIIPEKQVIQIETKQKLSLLKKDIVAQTEKKELINKQLVSDNYQSKFVHASSENLFGNSRDKLLDIFTSVASQDEWINEFKFANVSLESDLWQFSPWDNKTVMQDFDFQLNPEITTKDSLVEQKEVIWSIDPKKVKLRPMLSREEMFWRCSKMARLYLQSLWIKREDILVWNSIDLIKMLRKTQTWTEYRADELTAELLARAKEWKGNMYDIYFITPFGHRVIVFIWTDSELYVLDPYYTWNKPVKIMNYFLSKTWKWYRSVMVPNKNWYIIEDSQLLSKKNSSK